MIFTNEVIQNIFIDKEAIPVLQTIPLRVSIDKIPATIGTGDTEKKGVLFLALGLKEVSAICNGFRIISRNKINLHDTATITKTTITVPVISICLEVL